MLKISDKEQYVADLEFDIPPYDEPAFAGLEAILKARTLGFDERNLGIVGLAGAGKTKLKDKLVRRATELLVPEFGPKAVLSLEAPGKATPRNFIEKLLHAVGDEFHSRDTIGGGETRISELLKACGTVAVFVDESHHMASGKSKKELWDMTEVVKNIGTIANLCFVYAGIPLFYELCSANSQFRRRLHCVQELEPFDWSSDEGKRCIRLLLRAIDKALPFSSLANLEGEEFAFRIYQATSGEPGLIIPLCKKAALWAIGAGDTALKRDHFDLLYKGTLASARPKHANPFSDELSLDAKPVRPGIWMATDTPRK